METLIQFDHKIFLLINQVLTHEWLDLFFTRLTDFTKTAPFYGVLVFLLIWIFRQYGSQGILLVIGGFLLASLADTLSSLYFKDFFVRPRPQFASLPFEVILRRPSEGTFSFPSSHAFDAFTFAIFLFFFSKPWGGVAIVLASLVAFSRVYVGLHFPSDVLAGAILGIILGAAGARTLSSLQKIWRAP